MMAREVASLIRRLRPGRTGPADAFARRHFGGCATHAEEARAVFVAVERMRRSPLRELDPDAALRDVLPERAPADDSLRVIELELAFEQRLEDDDLERLTLRRLADDGVMRALLGPSARRSSWDPTTIWARSARGVVNERVRLESRACSCADVRTVRT